jgi:hypothetical protein
MQETGLQLKQINNWFINQRKRNWHSNPTSSGEKTKKKRCHKENCALLLCVGLCRVLFIIDCTVLNMWKWKHRR